MFFEKWHTKFESEIIFFYSLQKATPECLRITLLKIVDSFNFYQILINVYLLYYYVIWFILYFIVLKILYRLVNNFFLKNWDKYRLAVFRNCSFLNKQTLSMKGLSNKLPVKQIKIKCSASVVYTDQSSKARTLSYYIM